MLISPLIPAHAVALAITALSQAQLASDEVLEILRRSDGPHCPADIAAVTPKPKQLPPPEAATKGEP